VYQVGAQVSYAGSKYQLAFGPRGGQCPGFTPNVDNWWNNIGACN
jgi:hypothetical protein